MRIDLLGLQAFVSIAERGSFHQAASQLNLSQTALSHRIRKLECDLGTILFKRTKRAAILTAAGADLLPKIQRCIGDLSVSLDELRLVEQQKQDWLSFGCLPTVAAMHLAKAVATFERKRPDVRLRIHDKPAKELHQLVIAGDAEFALTIVSDIDKDLQAQTLLKEPFFLVCHKDHPLAGEGEVDCDRLTAFPLVRICPQTGHRQLLDDALGARRELLRWKFEVQRTSTAINLVEAGLGVTIVPQLALELYGSASVIGLRIRNPSLSRTLGIVSPRGCPLSPAASDFCDIILGQFGKNSA